MADDSWPPELLKVVFPLLTGPELAACMCVSRQWRNAAKNDHLWRILCGKRWPSTRLCTGSSFPIGARGGYFKLFSSLFRPSRSLPLPSPELSFLALEFYLDIWLDSVPVHSEVVPGSVVSSGMLDLPAGICKSLRDHLRNPSYKMTFPVSPRFEMSFSEEVHASLVVRRRDKDQVACIVDDTIDYVDGPGYKAHVYDFLQFSPQHSLMSDVRAWLDLLLVDAKAGKREVFGIELDFGEAADSNDEALLLLDTLDWK